MNADLSDIFAERVNYENDDCLEEIVKKLSIRLEIPNSVLDFVLHDLSCFEDMDDYISDNPTSCLLCILERLPFIYTTKYAHKYMKEQILVWQKELTTPRCKLTLTFHISSILTDVIKRKSICIRPMHLIKLMCDNVDTLENVIDGIISILQNNNFERNIMSIRIHFGEICSEFIMCGSVTYKEIIRLKIKYYRSQHDKPINEIIIKILDYYFVTFKDNIYSLFKDRQQDPLDPFDGYDYSDRSDIDNLREFIHIYTEDGLIDKDNTYIPLYDCIVRYNMFNLLTKEKPHETELNNLIEVITTHISEYHCCYNIKKYFIYHK